MYWTLFSLICHVFSQQVKVQEDPNAKYVANYNSESFTKAVSEQDYLLVDFHATWCSHCVEFEPELNRLGKLCFEKSNQDISIQISKINMAEEDQDRSLGQRYGINYYPTLILFIRGIPIKFDKEQKTASGIYNWMVNIIQNSGVRELESEDDFLDHIQNNQYSSVLFGVTDPKNDYRFWAFFQLASTQDGNPNEIAFAYVRDEIELILKHAPSFGSLVAYKINSRGQIDSKTFNFDFTDENLQRFFIQLTEQAVVAYNPTGERLLQAGRSAGMILFVNNKDNSKQAEIEYQKFAEEHEQQLIFTISRVTDSNFWATLEAYGNENATLPLLMIVKYVGQQSIKYRLDDKSITAKSLNQFYNDYKNDKLKRIWLSSPIPQRNLGAVKQYVGLNFKEKIQRTQKDVLVFLYTSAPWCKLCKEWLPYYEEIAWEMKQNEDLVTFAKVDALENEVPLTVIQMPMLYIYRSNMKRIPVHFEGNMTKASIVYFLRNYTTKALNYPRIQQ